MYVVVVSCSFVILHSVVAQVSTNNAHLVLQEKASPVVFENWESIHCFFFLAKGVSSVFLCKERKTRRRPDTALLQPTSKYIVSRRRHNNEAQAEEPSQLLSSTAQEPQEAQRYQRGGGTNGRMEEPRLWQRQGSEATPASLHPRTI